MIASFAYAVLADHASAPTAIRQSGDRFNVYRNTFRTSVAGALADVFPVVGQLVGDEYFAALAQAFVLDHPPETPVLADYGGDFASFIAAFEPLKAMPYIADVARLEWARTRAFYSPDAPATDIGSEIDLIAAMQLSFHMPEGASLLSSLFPVGSLWQAHQVEPVVPVDDWRAETVAVWRNTGDVQTHVLSGTEHLILSHLLTGDIIGSIFGRATDQNEATDFLQSFAALVSMGLVVARI